jgi:parvulin-like peptidyl-prolyl isomerase
VKEAKAELIKQAEKVATQKIWFKRKIDESIKEEDLLNKYKKLQKNLKDKKMYNIAIIVLDDKAKANEVLKQAMAGKDFAELAKAYSTEPNTRERGGELGYLHELEIQQALGGDVAKRLKVLKDGVCSNKAIEKGGKQFILKRIGSKKAEAPKFEEVLPQLRAIAQQEIMAKTIKKLRDQNVGKIEVHSFSGEKDTPLKDASKIPASAGA